MGLTGYAWCLLKDNVSATEVQDGRFFAAHFGSRLRV